MQFLLKLHTPVDLDLIMIRKQLGSRFHGFVRNCLKAKVNGDDYVYSVRDMSRERTNIFEDTYQVNILFDDVKDADIVSFVHAIRPRKRSETIKCILRGYYDRFPLEVYRGYCGLAVAAGVKSPAVKKDDEDKKTDELSLSVQERITSVKPQPEPIQSTHIEKVAEPGILEKESEDSGKFFIPPALQQKKHVDAENIAVPSFNSPMHVTTAQESLKRHEDDKDSLKTNPSITEKSDSKPIIEEKPVILPKVQIPKAAKVSDGYSEVITPVLDTKNDGQTNPTSESNDDDVFSLFLKMAGDL